jgi:hypothetical protein
MTLNTNFLHFLRPKFWCHLSVKDECNVSMGTVKQDLGIFLIKQILPDIGVPPSCSGGFQRNVMTSGWWNCSKYSSVGGGTNSGQPGGLGKAEKQCGADAFY